MGGGEGVWEGFAGRARAAIAVHLGQKSSKTSRNVLMTRAREVFEGSPPLSPNPRRALACLVSRDSELAYLLRSLIKLSSSPPPPPPGLLFWLGCCCVVLTKDDYGRVLFDVVLYLLKLKAKD